MGKGFFCTIFVSPHRAYQKTKMTPICVDKRRGGGDIDLNADALPRFFGFFSVSRELFNHLHTEPPPHTHNSPPFPPSQQANTFFGRFRPERIKNQAYCTHLCTHKVRHSVENNYDDTFPIERGQMLPALVYANCQDYWRKKSSD